MAPAQAPLAMLPRLIVIGGSAGAVEVLLLLLPQLPAAFPVPLLVVVHLPANDTGRLAALFAARCALRVREAQHDEPIEAGCVYFAPADYHLLVERPLRCALSQDEAVHHSRPAIDVLFESAAWACRGELLGILLSGGNEDGALGLHRIRRAGGSGWVQAPETAAAPGMPRAALQIDRAHRIMKPAAMLAALQALARTGRDIA